MESLQRKRLHAEKPVAFISMKPQIPLKKTNFNDWTRLNVNPCISITQWQKNQSKVGDTGQRTYRRGSINNTCWDLHIMLQKEWDQFDQLKWLVLAHSIFCQIVEEMRTALFMPQLILSQVRIKTYYIDGCHSPICVSSWKGNIETLEHFKPQRMQ